MPIVTILLLAALVATFGFWGTLKGIIGAIGVVILLWTLVILAASCLIAWVWGR